MGAKSGSSGPDCNVSFVAYALEQRFSNLNGPQNHLKVKTRIDGPLLERF